MLLHFPLVVSSRGQFYPFMLASGTSGSEPCEGEYVICIAFNPAV